MRIFLAIPIKNIFEDLRKAIAPYGKLVEEENLHITIKFYGEKGEEEVKEIIKKLKTEPIGKQRIRLEGIGAFPSFNYIRVLFIKTNKDLEQNLAKRFPEINKPLHLTIARIKRKIPSEMLEPYKHKYFGELEVEKAILYNSTLTKKGPIYKKIEEIKI